MHGCRLQVTGAGTGVCKHPLFFLGVRHGAASKRSGGRGCWRLFGRRRKQQEAAAAPAGNTPSAAAGQELVSTGQAGGEDGVDPYYGSFSAGESIWAGSSQVFGHNSWGDQ